MRMQTLWTATALVAAMTMAAHAQTADFTGTWNLNLAKSFLGGEHPASNYQLITILAQKAGSIEQTDIARNVSMVNIPMPNSKTSTSFETDGKEHEVQLPGMFPGLPPTTTAVTAEWQGNTLFVTERANSFGRPSLTYRRYFLSDNGEELIELVQGHTSFGDSDQRLVFDKQP